MDEMLVASLALEFLCYYLLRLDVWTWLRQEASSIALAATVGFDSGGSLLLCLATYEPRAALADLVLFRLCAPPRLSAAEG